MTKKAWDNKHESTIKNVSSMQHCRDVESCDAVRSIESCKRSIHWLAMQRNEEEGHIGDPRKDSAND